MSSDESPRSINVSVMVDDAHRENLSGVAKALEKEGFVLTASLDEIGVLSGSVEKAALPRLSAVEGVTAIEQERGDYRTQGARDHE